MKFKPRTPQEGINVSDEHPLNEAATVILGLAAIIAGIGVLLVFLVDLVIWTVPPELEARVFGSWLPDGIDAEGPAEAEVERGQALLDRLAAQWPDAPYQFRLAVTESDDPNAMALPGGLIVVTSALLDSVEAENELAFVLGHELGHFRNRDHIRSLGRSLSFSILVATVLGGDSGGIGMQIADLTLLSFSRKQENDADEYALGIVFAEYGHVNESWRFFDRLKADADQNTRRLLAYFSTHPLTEDRIQNMKTLASERNWPVVGPTRSWQQ